MNCLRIAIMLGLGLATAGDARADEFHPHCRIGAIEAQLSAAIDQIRQSPAAGHTGGQYRQAIAAIEQAKQLLHEGCRTWMAGQGSAPQAPGPMSPADFAALQSAVDHESFSDGKLRVITTAAAQQHFTVAQLGALVDRLSFSKDKLDAVAALKDRLVDRANAFQLYGHFSFEADKKKARELLEH